MKKGLSPDEDSAAKVIENSIGKRDRLDYEDFYRLFCKGIFRTSLLDMMRDIEAMASACPELPLTLKIGAYRRNLMISGLGLDQGQNEDQGAAIIKALHIYKEEINPEAFSNLDFNAFLNDPMGKGKMTESEHEKNVALISKYEMHQRVERIRDYGRRMGVDPRKIEYELRDEAELEEMEQKKGRQ